MNGMADGSVVSTSVSVAIGVAACAMTDGMADSDIDRHVSTESGDWQ